MKVIEKIRSKIFQHYMLIVSVALLGNCVSPADIPLSEVPPLLVVEGFITDDFGPHEIRVTRLARFAGIRDGGSIEQVDASVSITDDLGNSVQLLRQNLQRKEIFNDPPEACVPNVTFAQVITDYRTPDSFKGEVGRSYTLEIETDGRVYRSEPQTIVPTPIIDELSLSFLEIPTLNDAQPRSGVEIFAKWQDPEEPSFYSWRVNGIYRVSTRNVLGGVACCLYDPADNGAEDCWIIEPDIEGNVIAVNDRFFNGQQTTQKVGFIEDDGLRFANTEVPESKQYYIEVEQYRISEEAYNFYDRVTTISSIDGEIFDPPPLSISGNITNIEDPSETVIGFFGAFSVQRSDIFVDRKMLSFTQIFLRPCGDCRVRGGAQVEVPDPYK
ncbi:MAG: DUF4249 domain-containing protein [Bacteroidota bacterium]